MDMISFLGDRIKSNALDKPERSLKYITSSLKAQGVLLDKMPNKKLPPSLNYLNKVYNDLFNDSLIHSEKGAFVNLFAPTELLHTYDIKIMTVEGIAAFLSGFKCEDFFINNAVDKGISPTLCSYHRAFIGAVESKIIPRPKFAITTSMVCDANIPSFEYIADRYNIPIYIIDVPFVYSQDAVDYVVSQLKELIEFIEDNMKEKFDYEKLQKIINTEKQSIHYKKKFFKELQKRYFPNTLTLEMFKLLNTYMYAGTELSLKINKMIYEDIVKMDRSKGKRILWVHMLPFYHEGLKKIFNCSREYEILCSDFNFPYEYEIDDQKPLESLARKLILNPYNQPFEYKVKNILDMAEELSVDGVMNFCHWGCKQSCGGVYLLKDALMEKGIPFLSIDGDGVDRRNTQNGQLMTRVQAFLEIMEGRR